MGKSRLVAELFASSTTAPGPPAGRQAAAARPTGGDRLLGARGDRQGGVRDPGVRFPGGGGGEARARLPPGGSRPALAQGPPGSARGRSRGARLAGGVLHRLAPRSRRGRRRGRRSSSSRTCTGQTRRCLPRAPGRLGGGVPLLVLCTARPELYEQHPTFGANARNSQRINLAPLTDEETARLIASLLERAVLPAETQRALLERAGGNPLYAEEFVRLLADRGELVGEGEVPDSVQALIAARLDTLSPERKSLLQDAAVIGKVFWAGALAEMAGREPARSSRRCTSSPARSCASPARARWRESRSTASGTCWSGTSATSRFPVPHGPPATRGGRLDRARGRASGRPGRRARPPLPASPRARACCRADGRRGGSRGERDPLPRPRRRARARPRHRPGRDSVAQALALCPPEDHQRPELLRRWAERPCRPGARATPRPRSKRRSPPSAPVARRRAKRGC